MILPGYPVADPFRWRPAAEVALPPAALARVQAMIESSRRARLRALADASTAVIGAGLEAE